ncbi:MAG: ammonium transporter [Deltaproteobacteria bacterium]|nr:ammonium transporter [Deltaproteobacteria bacterium]
MGGFISLAGAIVIGPRIGKFVNGKPQAIPAHDIPAVVLGTFILCFGWFGFNPGSTLSGTDLRISYVIVNTMLAGIMGAIASMVTLQAKGLKPDPSMMCNGMLAGLVAITAPCAFVDPWAAAVIGGIAGVVVVFSVFFWGNRRYRRPRRRDLGTRHQRPVGRHLGGNLRHRTVRRGLERRGAPRMVEKYGSDGVRGLLYGDISQLWAQLLNAAVVAVFGFVMAYVWFKISDKITPIRVSKETELQGLDGPEMGALAYPDFPIHSGPRFG